MSVGNFMHKVSLPQNANPIKTHVGLRCLNSTDFFSSAGPSQ